MKNKILKILYSFQGGFFKILNIIGLGAILFYFPKSYLKQEGWFKSYRRTKPVDNEGKPIPWFTYPSLEFLKKRINKNMSVFEYGSGSSTLWWSERVKRVVSCEHDFIWYSKMKKKTESFSNVELLYRELEEGYEREAFRYTSTFDIIVIDGRERIKCAVNSLRALKDDGVIIWDNSDRTKYSEGFETLLREGFKRIGFKGIGAGGYRSWETSIFYKTSNCLRI